MPLRNLETRSTRVKQLLLLFTHHSWGRLHHSDWFQGDGEEPIYLNVLMRSNGLLCWLVGEESTCQCRQYMYKSLSQGHALEKEMAIHSSVLAWEIL